MTISMWMYSGITQFLMYGSRCYGLDSDLHCSSISLT
jgi:hypothetical protein